MSSVNPKATFDQMVNTRPEAKTAMNIVNQYGNGDPKAAFMNYAKSKGQSEFAKSIMTQLGLN